jgi:hypothetical protein
VNKRRAIATLVLATAIATVAAWSLLRPPETNVYAAALAPYPEARPLLTSRPGTCGVGRHAPGIPDSLISSFISANGPDARPISLSSMHWRYDIAPAEKIKAYSILTARNAAASRGGQLVFLSRVGFNPDRSEALFCLEGNGGWLFYLRLTDGVWKVVQTEPTWIP